MMKQKGLEIINRALLRLIAVLIVLLLIGTIFGIVRSSDKPLFTLGRTKAPQQSGTIIDDSINFFTGIGRLRIPLVNSSTLILSIAFPYPADDITFTEELAGKIGELRSIAIAYFSALPADKIIIIDEETAKNEILKRYNTTLRLGRIEALYFSDLIIIE